MSVDERTRHEMYAGLEAALGSAVADALMAHLPPTGWADVARTHDVDVLRGEMVASLDGLRHEMVAGMDGHRRDMLSLKSAWACASTLESLPKRTGFCCCSSRR